MKRHTGLTGSMCGGKEDTMAEITGVERAQQEAGIGASEPESAAGDGPAPTSAGRMAPPPVRQR